MTGYSSGEVAFGDRRLAIEIRAVNHRFLDISVKMPRTFLPLEADIKKHVAAHIGRGKIEVLIQYAGQKGNGTGLTLDVGRARLVGELLHTLQREVPCPGDVDLAALLAFKDFFMLEGEEPAEPELIWQTIQPCLEHVLQELAGMQKAEGATIAVDIASRLDDIARRFAAIASRSAQTVSERIKALQERVRVLCGGVAVDEQRMLQEIALLADRSDITEELVRAQSHVEQFRRWLDSEDAVGKRLDFLVQELYREVNTIGSKSADAEISLQVVGIKNELEKIREQVQNVM